jgi:membrane associated rhomboid family serine protease
LASRVAVVTYLLIAVNILVFSVQLFDPNYYNENLITNYGLIPADIIEGRNLFTLVTSMFLHGSLIHLGMNMFFLLITGDGCERAMGSSRFLVFYLACGVLSGLFHTYMNSTSGIPTIGASGAIFGVLAAFAIMFPFRWLISLFGLVPIPIPAIIFVFIEILSETALVASGVVDYVAHTAHLGGFLAGVFLTLLFGPKKHELEEQ